VIRYFIMLRRILGIQLELSENSACFESYRYEYIGLYAGPHNVQVEVSAKTGNR